MDASKPTIIFTTFWDALSVSDNGGVLHEENAIRFSRDECVILSVALAKPKIPDLNNVERLDFFCPSWNILKDYKKNRDWDIYTNEYRKILVQNKVEISEWVDSLEKKVYFLCCWENTVSGANCHRRILYDALSSSKRTKDVANYIFRHGEKECLHKEKQLFCLLDNMDSSPKKLKVPEHSPTDADVIKMSSLMSIISVAAGDSLHMVRDAMGPVIFDDLLNSMNNRE